MNLCEARTKWKSKACSRMIVEQLRSVKAFFTLWLYDHCFNNKLIFSTDFAIDTSVEHPNKQFAWISLSGVILLLLQNFTLFPFSVSNKVLQVYLNMFKILVENINLLLKQWSYSHQVIDWFIRKLIRLSCDLIFNLFLSCSTILLEQALFSFRISSCDNYCSTQCNLRLF